MLRTHWCIRLPYRAVEEDKPVKRKLKFSVMIVTLGDNKRFCHSALRVVGSRKSPVRNELQSSRPGIISQQKEE